MNASPIASTTKVSPQSRTEATSKTNYKQEWLFVLQLNSGVYVVGAATNPSRRIAAINTGYNKAIPEALSVYRIVGIKEQTDERTLISVTKQLCDRFGSDRVITV